MDKVSYKKGQVVIGTVLFFIVISLAVLSAISIPTSNQINAARDSIRSKQSYAAADAVNDDALYRLNLGKTLPASIVLSFSNNVSASAQITTVGTQKQILTTGSSGFEQRSSQGVFSQGVGTSFSYGLQIGTGGVSMDCGTINGSIYSNGDFAGTNCTTVTGSVTVANTSDPTANQTNSTTTPDYNLKFGDTASTQDIAQAFKMSTTTKITNVDLYIKKTGTPADATVRIVSDSSGKPGTTSLGSGTLSASLVTTSYGYVEVAISPNVTPSLNTTYWIVIDPSSSSSSNNYTVAATNGTYANGTSKIGVYGGTWNNETPSTADLYFDIYVGGHNGTIYSTSGSQYNPITIGGSAYAHQVNYAKVGGTGYCQASTYLMDSSGNTKVCDNSQDDPVQLTFPVSSGNITDWKSTIASSTNSISGGWTYTGNLTINYAGTTTTSLKKVNGSLTLSCNTGTPATFGDIYVTGDVSAASGCTFSANTMKVDGNFTQGSGVTTLGTTKIGGKLTVSGGGKFNLKGMLWTGGDITVSGSGSMGLDSSLGTTDGLVITDGKVSNSGGGYFTGSGTTGSYIMAVTTSAASDAVSLSGGSGSVVLVAPYGTVNISGGASAKEITANALSITGNSTVTYETGLSSLNFTSGPSGSWKVSSWQEVAQ